MQAINPFNPIYLQVCDDDRERIICKHWEEGVPSRKTGKELNLHYSQVLVIRRSLRKRAMRLTTFPSYEERRSRVVVINGITYE